MFSHLIDDDDDIACLNKYSHTHTHTSLFWQKKNSHNLSSLQFS